MGRGKFNTKVERYRSAKTGQYVTKQFATRHPATTVSEAVKKAGSK